MVWEAADVVAFVGILAHQGGWDEMLMVAVPIGLFVALLRIANTRAGRQADASAAGSVDGREAGSEVVVDPDSDA